MAKILISSNLGYDWLADLYAPLSVRSVTSKKIVLSDNKGGTVTFEGSGFVNSKTGISAGTIATATFATSKGTLLSVTGGKFDAKALSANSSKFTSLTDLLTGLTAGNDQITGSTAGDGIIIGQNAGNDTILAGKGDDFIKGSAGNNTIDGGIGFDTLSYDPFTTPSGTTKKGITADLSKGTVKNPWGGLDTFKNIEEVRGTNEKDVIQGGSKDDWLTGLKGADTLSGGGGTDVVNYASDFDLGGKKGIVANLLTGKIVDGFGTVDLVSKVEDIQGTRFADQFTGNKADNLFRGLAGKDSYDGGDGNDALSFRGIGGDGQGHGATVNLRLTTGQVLDDGYGNKETAKNIESLEGSGFADNLTLSDKAGGYVWGDGGNDRLVAGGGYNWLGGGEGADRFVFLSAKDSRTGSGSTDRIDDFSRSQGDKIDLSAIGDLVYLTGGKHSGHGGSVVSLVKGADTIVSADVNGDGVSDFEITLTGSKTLVAGDFIL